MAYASAVALTVQEISRAGKAVSYPLIAPTATHGNKFLNDGRTWHRVKNGSGAPITVTININKTVDGIALTNQTVSVAATGDGTGLDFMKKEPFPIDWNQVDGYMWITYSAVATVTVGAFRLAI